MAEISFLMAQGLDSLKINVGEYSAEGAKL